MSPRLFFTTLLVCTLSLSGCSSEHAEEQQTLKLPPVKVQSATVTSTVPKLQVEIMGTVQPVHSAVIATKVSGNITELPVELGSKVKQGQLLLQLDAGELTAKLNQSKAQLAQAKRNLQRDKNLLKKKAATPETVKTQQDMVNIAEAAYQEAMTMMEYTHVEAPFDGLITRKHVNLGDLVTPGRQLLQLDNDQELQVITNIPETLLPAVQLGDTMQLTITALNLDLVGTVAELAPTADPQSRTALVKLTIPPTENVRPGQFARVFIANEGEKTLTVPTSAISHAGQLDRVFVIKDNGAKLRLIRIGRTQGDHTEVLSGLSEGEIIVSKADTTLKDNQPVILQ